MFCNDDKDGKGFRAVPRTYKSIKVARTFFYKWVWPPPPVYNNYKKTDKLVQESVPYNLPVHSPATIQAVLDTLQPPDTCQTPSRRPV